jgi:hypothetical protein
MMNSKTKKILQYINRSFYLLGVMGVLFALLLSTVNFPAAAQTASGSSLSFSGSCVGACDKVKVKICNTGSSDMSAPLYYEVYYSPFGDPQTGSLVYTATGPLLKKGHCTNIHYDPKSVSGFYAFKAYQVAGSPDLGIIWSGTCEVQCGVPTATNTFTPQTPTSTYTPTPEDPTPTFTSTPEEPTPTYTSTPTFTSTPEDPTPTFTSTPEEPTPTFTSTPEDPTPTFTSTPEEPTPTYTSTPEDPTPTFTSTPEEPTPTFTSTPEDPTPTFTSTPEEPTPTNTSTPEEPTATPEDPTPTPPENSPTPSLETPTTPTVPSNTATPGETPEVPTLPPPVQLDTPSVLIPVTGADLSMATPANQLQKTSFNFGLAFIGLGMVLQGIRRRFDS